jgi:tripartite ATP-independent transporter DctP family solute receptor
MVISRRTFVALGASLPLGKIAAARAQTPDFTYRYANAMPDSHPLNIRMNEVATALKRETNGAFELKVFSNNQLGSDVDTLSQLRSGAVEFFSLSPIILSTLVPNASISGMGFAFPTQDAVWSAMDGDLGAYVRGQIEKANLIAMDLIWENGFRQVTSSTKPITSPFDLSNFKIRVPPSPLYISMFRAFGAAATSIPFNELYTALQTKVVDGQENPLAVLSTNRFYEVQKYCSMTNHVWDGWWLLANRRAWERVPKDIRAIVARNMNEAALKQREDVASLNSGLQTELSGKGLSFNDVQQSTFRQLLSKAGFYKEWKERYGREAWSKLESAVGELG